MGKKYDRSRDYLDFEAVHLKLIPEVFRITKPGGHICWETGYHVKNGVVTPLDILFHQIAQEIEGLFLRNRIIWTFGHGLHCRKCFSGRYETIMWYSKGHGFHFDLDAVRVAQKYPGKTYYKGVNKGKPSSHPNGKNPSERLGKSLTSRHGMWKRLNTHASSLSHWLRDSYERRLVKVMSSSIHLRELVRPVAQLSSQTGGLLGARSTRPTTGWLLIAARRLPVGSYRTVPLISLSHNPIPTGRWHRVPSS